LVCESRPPILMELPSSYKIDISTVDSSPRLERMHVKHLLARKVSRIGGFCPVVAGLTS